MRNFLAICGFYFAVGQGTMTDIEREDRLGRLKASNITGQNRVKDFVELMASMCADQTRAKKKRADEHRCWPGWGKRRAGICAYCEEVLNDAEETAAA